MNRLLVHIALLLCGFNSFGQNSVLNEGKWSKVRVSSTGVHRLSQDHFRRMGFDMRNLDPSRIRIFGHWAGMLPQENSVPRPPDLIELAIHVEGAEDGSFDAGDYVHFYAQGPRGERFQPGRNVFFLQSNLYSDFNFYFVTVGDAQGKRITKRQTGSGGTDVTTFHDFEFHELDEINMLRSGREWFGENFESSAERSFNFDKAGIAPNSEIIVVSEVMAQSYNPSSFELSYNGVAIGTQIVPIIADSQYATKGRVKRDTLVITASQVAAEAAPRQTLRYKFNRASGGRSIGFLNYFSVNIERMLRRDADNFAFRNGNARNGSFRFHVENLSTRDRVWDVSDPFNPIEQIVALEGGTAAFTSDIGNESREFIAFTTSVPAPELIGPVANQNLRGLTPPAMAIVTHPDFATEAMRLAAHRSAQGIDVAVVTTEQIYNEFSSGRQDVTAIRDFAKWLYERGPSTFRSLLLFGKSSYDYKQRIPGNLHFVPTYESRNSLSPLETYSSDDYFGFLENSEGEWAETIYETHTMDIGVGRIPVKTLEEARQIVDKLIRYDDQKTVGAWRKDIVFVADDGSNSDNFSSVHQSQANTMAENIELNHSQFNTRKIFLGTYDKKVSPNGETIPRANIDISEEFRHAVIVNYTGHGSEKIWADERVLTPDDIAKLKNTTMPFLVTATCEFGRHDDPLEISTSEATLLKATGGCIGLVTTARPVNSSTNFELNQAFYDALLTRDDYSWRTIGETFRRTKNNSTSGVANRNFSLLGDPSMTLALPQGIALVDEVKTEDGSDTLKALSRVVVRGRVLNEQGETDESFNGIAQATLFDKRTRFQTIGKNDPAYKFSQWFNPLFRGQASVVKGEYVFGFILPRNIAYEINSAKLSIYAYDTGMGADATGSSTSFKVGGSEPNPPSDNVAPLVEVFMGDSTFVDGATVSPNTTLVVRLRDDSGLNISNYGIGNTMMAALDDDTEVYAINEHFISDRDDFTKGWVHYPLYDLAPGRHSISVRAWDTHNNAGEGSVSFVVSENALVIQEFGNFPNPFQGETTLFFTHNRPGDDLFAAVDILSAAGAEIEHYDLEIVSSTFKVEVLKWGQQAGKKLAPGLYFARLKLRSLSDGAESVRLAKLIVSN